MPTSNEVLLSGPGGSGSSASSARSAACVVTAHGRCTIIQGHGMKGVGKGTG